jgi:Zn-dependent M16 (insulinase) family peptidase
LLRYYIDPGTVITIGKPSATLAEKLEKDETARVAAQIETLGPEGLRKAEIMLNKAKTEHERPIPKDVLTNFKIPSVKSISWIRVDSVQEPGKDRIPAQKAVSTTIQKHIQADGSPLPFFVQYDHVEVRVISRPDLPGNSPLIVGFCHSSCLPFFDQAT